MAKLLGYSRKTAHEKGEKQRQAVGVVESGGQHQRQQYGKPQPGTRGKNVEPPPLQGQRQGIGSLTPLDPGRHPLAEVTSHGRL